MKIRIDLHGQAAAPRSMGRLARALLREGEEGQAAVETTLILWFVLLPLVTGILVFGIAMNNYLQLTNAVSIAARTLAVSAGVTADPCATAATAVTNAAPGLVASEFTYTLTMGTTTVSAATCNNTTDASALASGTNVTLTVTYPMNLSIFKTVFSRNNAVLESSATELVQ